MAAERGGDVTRPREASSMGSSDEAHVCDEPLWRAGGLAGMMHGECRPARCGPASCASTTAIKPSSGPKSDHVPKMCA